jgi:hypothetical protein
VTVFAEIYDNISRQQRREIDAAVSLISESGKQVFTARDVIPNPSTSVGAGDPANRWTAYGLARDIPLKNVPAGRYLLKVEAALRDLRQNQAEAKSGTASAAVRETLITVQ